jgi:type IV pilus assembly protein PilB
MQLSKAELKTMLVDSGLLSESDFEKAAVQAQADGEPLADVLVESRLVPDQYLGQLVAERIGYPFVELQNQEIKDHMLRVVPERMARKSRVVAFGKDERERLKLAMADPADLETIRLIEKKVGVRAVPYYATAQGLQTALERYASDMQNVIRELLSESEGADDDEEGPAVEVVSLILNYAYHSGASDIHVEPREKEIVTRYRIDGILHDVVSLPRELLDPIISRIKVLAKMRTDEHFAAQDGKFQEVVDGERLDVRVSALPVVDGEKIVMRLLSEKGRQYSLADLGMQPDDLKKIGLYMKKSFGMILATGPTGSGKTTTMYAVLKQLNTRDVNIATIEDPIEYAINGINQIQVNAKTGLTFASGLRSIVRQDPDIVMVGEIRDEETAGIAVNAAMTGHLVLSTLHTNDAATTLPRFRDMKIEPFLIASSINLIMAQRLARKICRRCIASLDVKRSEVEGRLAKPLVDRLFSHASPNTPDIIKLFHGKGCERCSHTGYTGRIGIYELLEMTDKVRELVMANANAAEIRQQAIKDGMKTMLDDGIAKALTGVTTLEEVLRVAGQ